MMIHQEVAVAVAVGMVIGLAGVLAFSLLKAMAFRIVVAKQKEPAPTKGKRAYRRKVAFKAPADKSTVTTTSSTAKKRSGRPAEVSASTKKKPTVKSVVASAKKCPGRPTNAELAARKATAEKLIKSTTDVGSALAKNPVIAGQGSLLEKLLLLSPQQLHALQSMPIGEATYVPTKESLTT